MDIPAPTTEEQKLAADIEAVKQIIAGVRTVRNQKNIAQKEQLSLQALAPLLIVWLGATQTTIIVAGMSVAIFGSILSLYTSFQEIDPEKIKLIYTLHSKGIEEANNEITGE